MSLVTENLSVGYDKKALIDNICLEIQPGKIVTLIGPNGAGKSTILKSCAGLLEPTGGIISFDGNNLQEIDKSTKAQNISVMLTRGSVPKYMTAFDVVAVGRYQYTNVFGKLTSEDEDIIYNTLKTVGAKDFCLKEFDKLSDGQKQRVFLARALVQDTKILILDEPTSFLDIGYKLEFLNLINRFAKEDNKAILMSLHEVELAGLISDTLVCINGNNEIDRIGSPDDILCKPYISKLFAIEENKISSSYLQDVFGNTAENIAEEGPLVNELIDNTETDKLKKTKCIMIQGTMSNAGKSLITAGLCRIFVQDGYKVAPFKSQNMALNSYVTSEGLEMGRAQVVQAEAAKVAPSVYMNPILLKPNSDVGSQVIVNGKSIGNMKAKEYFEYKKSLIPHIKHALEELGKDKDIIVIEGAGSPAEINLKENDIVNMGMAKIADAPVLLVGDIDRGGVFAQLLGTIDLLDDEERDRVKGLIINKFRGDKSILDPGIEELTKKCNIEVSGVVPYMDINIEDEDSLTERFNNSKSGIIDIAVIKLPHISNFTDFMIFDEMPEVSVRYVTNAGELKNPDMIILPGTKNTISDMKWLQEKGLGTLIKRYTDRGGTVFGICGGYQMLGKSIADPEGVESGGEIAGLGLLDVNTVLKDSKTLGQTKGEFISSMGIFKGLSGMEFRGYEIHMGTTRPASEAVSTFTKGGTGYCCGNVYGTYIHGIFDNARVAREIVTAIAAKKDVEVKVGDVADLAAYKETQYDKLADILREYLNMNSIYKMMGINHES